MPNHEKRDQPEKNYAAEINEEISEQIRNLNELRRESHKIAAKLNSVFRSCERAPRKERHTMTETETFTSTPEIPRDRWSRPLIIPPGGGNPIAYTRCTTYVSALEDTYNLGLWQQRMVAKGLAERPDLLLSAASLVNDIDNNKTKINQLCDDAREAAAASAAATTGTALHALTERIDRGQPIGIIPDQYKPHLDAYTKATEQFEPVHVEQFTVHDTLKIGGTPDRIIRIAGHDGLYIADVKTGSISYGIGKIAMQLAVYSRSTLYRPDGARAQIRGLNTSRGIIIHLDAKTGTCDLVWVNLDAGWDGVQLCTHVRDWRNRKGFTTPYQGSPPLLPATVPIDPGRDATHAAISEAIRAAATVEELIGLWTEAKRNNVWTDRHTEQAAEQRTKLTTQATPNQNRG